LDAPSLEAQEIKRERTENHIVENQFVENHIVVVNKFYKVFRVYKIEINIKK
jgi:hypothetical protein